MSSHTITRSLSVRPPWSGAIVSGYKPLENRTWGTSYRGRIAIHQSGKDDATLYRSFTQGEKIEIVRGAWIDTLPVLLNRKQTAAFRRTMTDPRTSPTPQQLYPSRAGVSAIIGTVDLVDCIYEGDQDRDIVDAIRSHGTPEGYSLPADHWYMDTQFAWIFARPILFIRPIPCHGKLNLWQLSAEQSRQVREAEQESIEMAAKHAAAVAW